METELKNNSHLVTIYKSILVCPWTFHTCIVKDNTIQDSKIDSKNNI